MVTPAYINAVRAYVKGVLRFPRKTCPEKLIMAFSWGCWKQLSKAEQHKFKDTGDMPRLPLERWWAQFPGVPMQRTPEDLAPAAPPEPAEEAPAAPEPVAAKPRRHVTDRGGPAMQGYGQVFLHDRQAHNHPIE